MTMSRLTAVDRARIAIALWAVKLKPEGQSFASYVLDLRAKFPCASMVPFDDVPWRARVLGLEQDLANLQTKYDQDHIKLLSLQPLDAVAVVAPTSTALSTTKKKTKKKLLKHPDVGSWIDLEAVLNGLRRSGDFPTISTSQSVFAAFDALKTLTDSANEEVSSTALLAAVTGRAVENLGALFKTLLSPESCSSTSAQMLNTVSTLLSFLLTVVLPLFISRLHCKQKVSDHDLILIAALDEILGQLTAQVLIPLTRSFGSLSQFYITSVLSTKHPGARGNMLAGVDIRSDLCCLFREAMSDLDHLSVPAVGSLVDSFRSVKERVALESVREIDKACLVREVGGSRRMTDEITAHTTNTRTSRTYTDRIHKLAKKDTLWFLCTILHTLFIPSSAPPVASLASKKTPHGYDDPALARNNLLEDAILTGLSSLLERDRRPYFISPCHSIGSDIRTPTRTDWCGDTENGMLSSKCSEGDAVDEVGHGMILAVVERVWSCWFQPRTNDGSGIL